MSFSLLAKDDGTLLREHLFETLREAEKILNEYNVDPLIRKATLHSSALHDVGKADSRIQEAIKQKAHPKVSHPLLTLSLVGKMIMKFIEPPYDSLSIIAIASHHSPFTRKLFMEYDVDASPKIDQQALFEVKLIISELISSMGIGVFPPELEIENGVRIFLKAKENLVGLSYIEERKLREDFIIIQGVLMQADWLASSRREREPIYYPNELVRVDKRRDDLNRFQELASLVTGDIFITLPTGFGKTETSLFWAKTNKSKRLFYLLPTRTTINAMYKRLRNIWCDQHGDVVGLWHSRAEFYISKEKIEKESIESLLDELLMYKYFFNPVNITTPDQLILSLMNYKKYTLKSFPLRDSLVIIDEVHVYDEETLGLITGLVKHLKDNYNVKFCIMSATFPREIKKQFSFLNAKDLLPEEEVRKIYRNLSRTTLKVYEEDIFKAIPHIIHDSLKKKKVLVVLNTVSRAQKFYLDLREQLNQEYGRIDNMKIMLLHSRFTQRDRIEKEEVLSRRGDYPDILVSTQVVNVSLDIDYDTLYTESCYPDELYQRAGRVNRKSLGGVKPIHVFKPLGYAPYNEKLIDRAWNIITQNYEKVSSELDYITLVEHFYEDALDKELIEESQFRYETIWRNLGSLYSIDLSEKEIQKLIKTRSGFINIPALPNIFLDELVNLVNKHQTSTSKAEKQKIKTQIMEMLVDIPLNYKTINRLKPWNDFWIIDADYDNKLGLLIDEHEVYESII